MSNLSIESEIVSDDCQKIPVLITQKMSYVEPKETRVPVRKTIKRNNAILKALNLPVIMNINPRSIYNKTDDFALLVDQYEADVICMSEK